MKASQVPGPTLRVGWENKAIRNMNKTLEAYNPTMFNGNHLVAWQEAALPTTRLQLNFTAAITCISLDFLRYLQICSQLLRGSFYRPTP